MNRLPLEKRAQILHCLVEGNSIRGTSRLTGTSKNTVTKLLVDVGRACQGYQDMHLRDLACERIQVDEIWSFVYSKQENTPKEDKREKGDIWTWTAICADTKLVPTWLVGPRDAGYAQAFIGDLASRMSGRIQLSSDGLPLYKTAVESAFAIDVDFAQLIKIYGDVPGGTKGRYSPGECIGAEKRRRVGNPAQKHISASYAERQNLTMRMAMRQFTRLTNAFSKKLENHALAVALHFMHYNFVRIHKSLKVTSAMAANVTSKLWEVEDIVRMADQFYEEQNSN